MVILDTNIIIELYKGNLGVRATCEDRGEENLFISSVVVAEFYSGVRDKKEFPKVQKHIRKFPVIHINESISEIAIGLVERYCLSHHPYIGDMLIAATALHYNVPIFTLNRKDFKHIPKLKLI
jgi:predicted nucleic acid-binding protein